MPREVGQRSEFRVCADNERFPAQSAFASPGQVGVDLVQFRLDASIPAGTIPFSIAVNGVSSNSIDLPIQ